MFLPRGYVWLEYIESTGTQYIDTGFKPNQDTKIVVDGMWTRATAGANFVFYGARTSASSKSYYWMLAGTGGVRSGYNESFSYEWSIDPTVRRTVTKDKNTTTVDGASHSWTYAQFQCDYNLTLFALNEVDTVKWFSHARVYSCQIYDNGTLIRDYVPCISPGGKAGLYDIVNGVFYGNARTGAFVPGPEKKPLQHLVTDRTLADVATVRSLTEAIKNGTATAEQVQQYLEAKQKGSYNYTDFNRVEEAVLYVAEGLKEYGYLSVPPITRSWSISDKPNQNEFAKFLGNVAIIRDAIAVWASTPETPSSMVGFDVNKANDLEQILIDVDQLLNNMQAAWFFLDDLYAGEA